MSDELAELKKRHERLTLLFQVGKVIHSTLEPREALELILGEAVRLMRASSGSVALVNPTTGFLEIHAAYGLPVQATHLALRIGEGLTGWVARTCRPARVGDVSKDRRYVMVREQVRSELAVPLQVDGEVRGVLNVDSERLDAFSADDQELLEELALQAARVIHNTWLYEQLRLKARLFESLTQVGQTINSTLSLDDALTAITREACKLMEARMCSLLMLSANAETLELRACHGAGAAYRNKPPLSVEESLVGIVVRRKKPIQVANVQASPLYQGVAVARAEGLVSLLSVPMVYGAQAIGALNVYTAELHVFSNEEIRILSALADLSAVAIERARLYERIVAVDEQLRQHEKLSALGLLAAEVAHEIRNPLTVMKMLYHSLDLRFPSGDPRGKDAEILGQKIEHLNRIVERILVFARVPEPAFSEVHLNDLLDDLALLTRHKLASQNVELVCKLDTRLPAVRADGAQLEQAFLNLWLNALEAMPQGGTLTITTRSVRLPKRSRAPAHVAVEFRDTGHGMTNDQRRRVFTSLLSTSKAKGTGLGLAIVTKIVEAHGGKIKLRSRPGHGSTFSVLLPVNR